MQAKLGGKRDVCRPQNSRLYLIILVQASLFTLVNCSVYRYYEAYPVGEITPTKGKFYFRTYSLDHEDKGIASTNVDTEFSMKQPYFAAYSNFIRDTNYTYWSIHVYHSGMHSAPSKRLRIDSVKIHFDQQIEIVSLKSLDTTTHIGGYTADLAIAPIGVPKSYKKDFKVSFILSIYYDNVGSLVDTLPIELVCRREKELLSSWWPGK